MVKLQLRRKAELQIKNTTIHKRASLAGGQWQFGSMDQCSSLRSPLQHWLSCAKMEISKVFCVYVVKTLSWSWNARSKDSNGWLHWKQRSRLYAFASGHSGLRCWSRWTDKATIGYFNCITLHGFQMPPSSCEHCTCLKKEAVRSVELEMGLR